MVVETPFKIVIQLNCVVSQFFLKKSFQVQMWVCLEKDENERIVLSARLTTVNLIYWNTAKE